MAMGFASKSEITQPSHAQLERRAKEICEIRYYSPEVHLGAFGLPTLFRT